MGVVISLYLPFLYPHIFPFSSMGPLIGLLSFKNCSSMGLLHRLHFLGEHPLSPVWDPPWAARISAPAPDAPPLTPYSLTLKFTGILFSSYHQAMIFPFLNLVPHRHHHLGCWAHPCPALGLLEPDGNSPGLPSQCSPAAPCCLLLNT